MEIEHGRDCRLRLMQQDHTVLVRLIILWSLVQVQHAYHLFVLRAVVTMNDIFHCDWSNLCFGLPACITILFCAKLL